MIFVFHFSIYFLSLTVWKLLVCAEKFFLISLEEISLVCLILLWWLDYWPKSSCENKWAVRFFIGKIEFVWLGFNYVQRDSCKLIYIVITGLSNRWKGKDVTRSFFWGGEGVGGSKLWFRKDCWIFLWQITAPHTPSHQLQLHITILMMISFKKSAS